MVDQYSTVSYQQLKTLNDVLLTALANGESIKWDSVLQKWINFVPASSINITSQYIHKPSTTVQSGSAIEDVSGMSIVLPNRSGGKSMLTFLINFSCSAVSYAGFEIYDDGIHVNGIEVTGTVINQEYFISISYIADLSGQTVKLRALSGSGVITVYASVNSEPDSGITSLEIS